MYELQLTHEMTSVGIHRLTKPRTFTYTDTKKLDKHLRRLRKLGLTGKGGRHYTIYVEDLNE
jgi:hypothetical protein